MPKTQKSAQGAKKIKANKINNLGIRQLRKQVIEIVSFLSH
jgi:hypothetical protein